MFVAASNLASKFYLGVCLAVFPKILRQVATSLPPISGEMAGTAQFLRQVATSLPPISGEMAGTAQSTQWIILDRPTLR
jgi:hypothetical protein